LIVSSNLFFCLFEILILIAGFVVPSVGGLKNELNLLNALTALKMSLASVPVLKLSLTVRFLLWFPYLLHRSATKEAPKRLFLI
jgi:hypothetical protein